MITNPQSIQNNDIVRQFHKMIGAPPAETFIIWICFGFVGIFIIKNIYLIALAHIQNRFVEKKQIGLAKRLFNAYVHSPYTFHLSHNSAELLRNVTAEVLNVGVKVLVPMLLIGTDLVIILCVVGFIIMVDPTSFFLIVAILGGSSLIFNRVMRRKVSQLGLTRQVANKHQFQWVSQGLGGLKEVKVLGREEFFVDAFVKHSRDLYQAIYMQKTILMMPRPFNETTMVIGTVVIIVLNVFQGHSLQSSLPTLALFAAAGTRLIPTIARMSSSINMIRSARFSLDVVYHDLVLLEERSVAEQPLQHQAEQNTSAYPPAESAVALQNVFYHYPDAKTYVVNDLSLTVPKYASVGLVGSSGAGKTTIVDIILGLLPPTSGKVAGYGEDIYQQLHVWQRKIGYIPQTIFLSDDTIRANVAFGIHTEQIDEQCVKRAVKMAQLEEMIANLPQGLDTVIGEDGVRLSGGQRQRIGIARALYHDPEILVMDEATASLDNQTERAFIQAIETLSGTKTLIIIAHRLSTVKHCDILYVIKNGKVINNGTYDELLGESQEFRAMVGVA